MAASRGSEQAWLACMSGVEEALLHGYPAQHGEVDPGSVIADLDAYLAALLSGADDHPALRRRMGAAGRRRVEEDYGLGRMVRDYEQLYEEMLARR